MSWIINHARYWRTAGLLLLIAALIIGPWVYDSINVPAEYPCKAPNVRLEGDFCGLPMSGTWVLFGLIGGLFNMVAELVTGTMALAESDRGLLLVLVLLSLILPILSTLLMIFWGNHRWLQSLHFAVLCLSGGLILWVLSVEAELRQSGLWGSWLYFATLAGLLVLEAMVFFGGRGSSQVSGSIETQAG